MFASLFFLGSWSARNRILSLPFLERLTASGRTDQSLAHSHDFASSLIGRRKSLQRILNFWQYWSQCLGEYSESSELARLRPILTLDKNLRQKSLFCSKTPWRNRPILTVRQKFWDKNCFRILVQLCCWRRKENGNEWKTRKIWDMIDQSWWSRVMCAYSKLKMIRNEVIISKENRMLGNNINWNS
jgi:hypothetical protein